MISTIAKPFTASSDERGSGRVASNFNTGTCGQCRFYKDGICQTKARAEWSNSAVLPTRKACFLAELCPF
jgi:hypothetical protein